MVVVGPEDPLVEGIHDFFLNDEALKNVAVIGPQKAAAQLEGSKEFAKEFLYQAQHSYSCLSKVLMRNRLKKAISFWKL